MTEKQEVRLEDRSGHTYVDPRDVKRGFDMAAQEPLFPEIVRRQKAAEQVVKAINLIESTAYDS